MKAQLRLQRQGFHAGLKKIQRDWEWCPQVVERSLATRNNYTQVFRIDNGLEIQQCTNSKTNTRPQQRNNGCWDKDPMLDPKIRKIGASDHKATGPHVKHPAINHCANTAPSEVPRLKTRPLKVKSEALVTESLPSSMQSILHKTDGLLMFAKSKWCTSFLPTLYACLGSAMNPWQLYEDSSTFTIML